jgi:hypothetical protein
MALQPTQTNANQRLRMQLQRDKASLETKKGSRGVALDISTNPKETPARRAEFKAKYDKLIDEISDLESKIASATKEVARAKTEKSKGSAKEQTDLIKEEFDLLAAAYADNEDPAIKAKMDALAEDYRDVYAKTLGTPISRASAYTILSGSRTPAPRTTAEGPTGTPAPTPTTPTRITSGGTTGSANIPGVTTDKTSGGKTGGTNIPGVTTDKTVGGTTGKTIPPGFDVGTFRMADEASMAAAEGITPGATVRTYDEALLKAQKDFNLPDIIFSNVKSLGDLLDRYVNPKKYGKNGISDINQFIQLVQNDAWFRQNSTEIKARYLQKFNYDDLVKSGNAKGTTDYEQKIAQITNNLITKARQIGSALDEGQAKLMAEDLYIYNQDADDAVVTRRLVSGIRPIAGMIGGRITEDFSGLALQNYQGLQALAKKNGMRLENILPPGIDGKPATAEETLKRLALGELDPTRLAQDVRKLAAVGQPQFVRDLLGQGIDLDAIYSPYRRTMARILELDEGQIDLMDPTLRMGINEKGDVNLYDYEKALRQDSRWQYTGDAREKVSDSALTVLRNFGFQG